MSAFTQDGIPVVGTSTFLTATGLPVYRIGSTTIGLASNGQMVFGLPVALTGQLAAMHLKKMRA